MYHHYTVDEHSIRAIGLLARIEKGVLGEDHPLATVILRQVVSRRVLYVAVLLHDIAKGRGGDHSVLGADIALKLCPRFGLTVPNGQRADRPVIWGAGRLSPGPVTAFRRRASQLRGPQDHPVPDSDCGAAGGQKACCRARITITVSGRPRT
jgi:[protein-PII] uridylyltransferase